VTFSHEFRMMAQEGHLASTALLAGFEALAKLDYDKPGTVYSTLFQLATGLERIMKIAVVLVHKVTNDLANPSDAQLRRLGHSITELYAALRSADESRSITDGWFEVDTMQGELLAALSEFARGSRYYNIDQLVSGRDSPDPLTRWFAIHMKIADDALSYKRLGGIMQRARNHCEALGLFGWEMGPKGQWDLTIDVTYQLEVARVSRGHCVWIIIEILKPIYRLIDQLAIEVHQLEQQKGIETPAIPYMTEFFPFCLVDKDTAVRRKAWTTLFHIAGRL
jgi:hypothetical protein